MQLGLGATRRVSKISLVISRLFGVAHHEFEFDCRRLRFLSIPRWTMCIVELTSTAVASKRQYPHFHIQNSTFTTFKNLQRYISSITSIAL